MSKQPRRKIYHILHVDRLASVAKHGLLSDHEIKRRGLGGTTIGMNAIKVRRLQLPVKCHPDLTVGEFVPFYFCPRSVMLYLLYRGNHSELAYRGGQTPILHLECDLRDCVTWARDNNRRWAFTWSNAGAAYTEFSSDASELNTLDWDRIANTNFTDPQVKEAKQSEFLMHKRFPWHLVERIGCHSKAVAHQASEAIKSSGHRPTLDVTSSWYY